MCFWKKLCFPKSPLIALSQNPCVMLIWNVIIKDILPCMHWWPELVHHDLVTKPRIPNYGYFTQICEPGNWPCNALQRSICRTFSSVSSIHLMVLFESHSSYSFIRPVIQLYLSTNTGCFPVKAEIGPLGERGHHHSPQMGCTLGFYHDLLFSKDRLIFLGFAETHTTPGDLCHHVLLKIL